MCYVGLELVVYGAVELGDVMLFFVGEQGLFGLEVYTRLVGQTDGVCDCGILATGLHEVLVGLTGHDWHCVSPLLCSNSSIERIGVNGANPCNDAGDITLDTVGS